ncbi:MAG: YhjD/YihY/BrkB family envelope integrity protein [Propionicimonas sp.]
MFAWWAEFSQRPPVAHLLRTVDRFTVRGGAQLAAAVTYFSVLSLVPILMLAFSLLGLTLTVIRPDVLAAVEVWIETELQSDSQISTSLLGIMDGALNNWASIGLVGLAIAIWVGSGWVGNLKRAVRLLMRSDVDRPGKQLPLPLDVLANFAGLIGLLIGVGVTFAATAVVTGLGSALGRRLGIEASVWWTGLLWLLGLAVALAAGTGLFRLLFGWFAPHPVPSHLAWVGALIGSAGLVVLQTLAGSLISAFSRNISTAVFGSTIVLMLFLNLFATLILFIAAWLATPVAPAIAAAVEPEPEPAPVERRPGDLYVSSEVARKSLGIGLGTGYVVGAATGVGLGALVAAATAAVFRRRWR